MPEEMEMYIRGIQTWPHLLEAPRTAGVHTQTLLTGARPSGGADVGT